MEQSDENGLERKNTTFTPSEWTLFNCFYMYF